MKILRLIIVCAFVTGYLASTDAKGQGLSCEQDYPCGPPSMSLAMRRAFVRQDFQGADFRFACRNHDECYKIPGVDRECCDELFLCQSLHACAFSSNPRRCSRVVRKRVKIIRKFGERTYRIRQGSLTPRRPVSH